MNITEARRLLTDRHSRIHDASGMIYVGLSLEDAECIAGLLPTNVGASAIPKPTPEPEKVVDTESGPVKVPQEKATKKKTKRRKKR